MRKIICLSLFLTSWSLHAQKIIRPSGNVVTLEKALPGFERLEASSDFEVYVTFSEQEEGIRLEVDENVADHVIAEVEDNTLRLKLGRLTNVVNINGNLVMKAYLTIRSLKSIRGRGDVKIFLEDEMVGEDLLIKLGGDSYLKGAISANTLELELFGDSKMHLQNTLQAKRVGMTIASDSEFSGSIVTEKLRADLTGDSQVALEGSAKMARVTVGGDSVLEDFDFTVGDLDIQLKSDSQAQLTVTESLAVRASGDSYFSYRGNPTIERQHLTGDSRVRKR